MPMQDGEFVTLFLYSIYLFLYLTVFTNQTYENPRKLDTTISAMIADNFPNLADNWHFALGKLSSDIDSGYNGSGLQRARVWY